MRLPKSWKKATAMLAAVAVAVVGDAIGLSENTQREIIAAISVYIMGQGIADQGKNAREVAQ